MNLILSFVISMVVASGVAQAIRNHFVFVLDASSSMYLHKDFGHIGLSAEEAATPWAALRMSIFRNVVHLYEHHRDADTFKIVTFRVFGDHSKRCELTNNGRCFRIVPHPNTAYGSRFEVGRDKDILRDYEAFSMHVLGGLDRSTDGARGGTQFFPALNAARGLIASAQAAVTDQEVLKTHLVFVSDGETQIRTEIPDCADVIRDLTQNYSTEVELIFYESNALRNWGRDAALADLNTMASVNSNLQVTRVVDHFRLIEALRNIAVKTIAATASADDSEL
jgi:hypothetical protein